MTQELPSEPQATTPGPPAEDRAASHAPEAVQSLKQAMRRARFDDAERVGVIAELRATQIGRLELLQEALRPLLAQIPREIELFDVGIMPGTTPRLFIDMIGFVEMGRDARVYRLLQDTRHTRITIAESAAIDAMVAAVTDYVARRLLERDKALAAEIVEGHAARAGYGAAAETGATKASSRRPTLLQKVARKPSVEPRPASDLGPAPGSPVAPVAQRSAELVDKPVLKGWRRARHWAALTFAFVIDLLGATAFFLILVFAGWLLWNRLLGQV